MNPFLKPHQRESLDRYEDFRKRYPKAFTGRALRPIVQDRQILEAYAIEHDIALGVVAATKYVYFIIDLVESTNPQGGQHPHTYHRVVYRKQLDGAANVVVLATIAGPSIGRVGDIVLVEQERHATGTTELELPRGFGELGLSGEENASRELRQETGFIGGRTQFLGVTLTDSGLTDAEVSFYHVDAVAQDIARPEIEEKITAIRSMSLDEVRAAIMGGRIRDSFTLQAIALFENQNPRK